MKRSRIIKDYLEYARTYGFGKSDHDTAIARLFLKEQMRTNAIHDNGIAKTFSFSGECYDLTLDYIKIEDTDIELYPDMFGKRTSYEHIYLHNRTYPSILPSCLAFGKTHEIDDKLNAKFEEIRKACVEKYNGVYSSVEILSVNIDKIDDISIPYTYNYIKEEFIDKLDSNDVIFGDAPLPYEEWFNLGSHSTDRPRKDSIAFIPSKDVYKSLKNKEYINYVDCTAPAPANNAIRYCSSDAMINELLLKENKNMRMIVHLLIVPKGMNEEFLNNTKKNLQSDDETTLYVSSNDIAFEPNDRYKTKYELLEHWVKSGEIHCVEFMVGYENDPEVKAFEAFIKGFIRGIKTNSSSVDTVNLWYQKDTIKRTIDSLRNDYVESSKARERLDNITDKIMDKVKSFKEYGLDDGDLDIIRNADCDKKDAYNATVDKITEIAFASDKKGTKKK